jgi:RHS repeat-associated protein
LVTGITAAGAGTGSVGYGYSTDLRVNSRTINGGNSVAYGYSNDGLLTSAGAMSLVWHAQNGTLSSTALGTVNTANTYNSFGEPDTETATSGANTLYSVDYDRDELGRITTKTETVGGVTTVYVYTYDNRGRLTNVTKDGAAWRHYDYDANGNRTSATEDGGAAIVGLYDAQDRLTSYGSATYTYDAMGQLTSRTEGSDATTYDYDELGTLMNVSSPSKTIDYVVDASGRRVARKIDGTTTNRYLYGEGILPVAELKADGTIKSQFVYGSDSHVPDYMINNGATYRFVTDQVGSVRLVVNTVDGTVAQRIDYDPFGRVSDDTNPGFQPFGFAGGVYDADTGLVLFGLRDYDAKYGRWLGKDPIGFSGGDPNLYAYVGSDPINNVDPSGLLCVLGHNPNGSCRGSGSAIYNWGGWDEAGTIAAGVGDAATFGSTYSIREDLGLNDQIDLCGWLYQGSNAAGSLAMAAVFSPGTAIFGYTIPSYSPYGPRPPTSPLEPPTPGLERMGPRPNWYDPKTETTFSPNLNHEPPIGPHWDIQTRGGGPKWRWFPDGQMIPTKPR